MKGRSVLWEFNRMVHQLDPLAIAYSLMTLPSRRPPLPPCPTLCRINNTMKPSFTIILTLLLSVSALVAAEKRTISLFGKDYFYRWSKDIQHEFTPEGQEDLAKWKDMLTINLYPDVKTGEELANGVLSMD